MKVMIDIGHPAHVHYFKNLIKIMEGKGHSFLVIARERGSIHYLLDTYSIDFVSRGKGSKTLIGKFFYTFYAYFIILEQAIKFDPDIFLSHAANYTALISFILGKPQITTEDTEHAKLSHIMAKYFSTVYLTPKCFSEVLSKNQIRFDGYMELCYLHPNYFEPDNSIWSLLGLMDGEKFVVFRFVSWDASHDVGQKGLSLDLKRKIVKRLSNYVKVFISTESDIPQDLLPYEIDIPPEKMHDVLAHASLFIGEGATMASECAMLGTPAIYINSLEVGYLAEQEREYYLLFGFREGQGVMQIAMDLINNPEMKNIFQSRRKKMLQDKIDVTQFMVWFIEEYPQSLSIMKENPDYQFRFK